jgi:hypothetical protein
LKTIIDKLSKLLPLLGSDKPGEADNARLAIGRLLASAKLDWHDLVTLLTETGPQVAELLRSLFEKDADVLLRLGLSGAVLFRTAERIAYADVLVGGHRMTWQLSDAGFGEWLLHQFFLERKEGSRACGDEQRDPLAERSCGLQWRTARRASTHRRIRRTDLSRPR